MNAIDIEKVKKYLSHKGYGTGSNFTLNNVANLIMEWQQERSYSEEEVLEITKKLHTEIGIQFSNEIKLWVIKQFKKK